jgi:hypothetical protein
VLLLKHASSLADRPVTDIGKFHVEAALMPMKAKAPEQMHRAKAAILLVLDIADEDRPPRNTNASSIFQQRQGWSLYFTSLYFGLYEGQQTISSAASRPDEAVGIARATRPMMEWKAKSLQFAPEPIASFGLIHAIAIYSGADPEETTAVAAAPAGSKPRDDNMPDHLSGAELDVDAAVRVMVASAAA